MSGQDFELRLKMSECQIRYGLHDAVVRMNVISGAAAPRLQFRLMQQVDEAVRSARKQSFCLEMISALNPTCFHLIPTSIEPCVHHDCRCLRSSKDLGAVTAYSYQRRREGWPKRRGSLRLFCAEPSAVLTSHASSFSLSPPCIYALLNLFFISGLFPFFCMYERCAWSLCSPFNFMRHLQTAWSPQSIYVISFLCPY